MVRAERVKELLNASELLCVAGDPGITEFSEEALVDINTATSKATTSLAVLVTAGFSKLEKR